MLQHRYLTAKIGFDRAENEPIKIWILFIDFVQFLPWASSVMSRDHPPPAKELEKQLVSDKKLCEDLIQKL